MVKLENINKYYKSKSGKYHALKDINLTLPDRGMVYIVGKSGSGKSTLLNIIGGIDTPDSGKITLYNENGDDKKLDTSTFKKKDFNAYRNTFIGFIFQEFNVIKSLTVYENVALSLELKQEKVKEHEKEIYHVLELVGLKGKEKRRINELSGGERQRVAIARALIKNPTIIIADEPTGNLDAKNRDIVMDILKKLSSEKLVLIVTHDKFLADRYGERKITIKDGSIINDEIIKDVAYDNEITPYELKQINPKAKVSFHLGLKGFKLHLVRFIFIIILFSISLILAGGVINLYLADPTYEYATFQEKYGNNVISLSDKYSYHGTDTTSGFFQYQLSKTSEFFNSGNNEMSTYKAMQVNIPIDRNLESSSFKEEFEGKNAFFSPSISRMTLVTTYQELAADFSYQEDYVVNADYTCYITDYLANKLYLSNYFNDENINPANMTGHEIVIPNSNIALTIKAIINTNWTDFYYDSHLTDTKRAVFQDNLTIYDSIFLTSDTYQTIYSADNLSEFTDDILYYYKDNVTSFKNVRYTTAKGVTYISGHAPIKPKKGDITQVAVSKGFVEQVLKLNVNTLNWTPYDPANQINSKLILSGNIAYNFYLAGVSRIPSSMEFNITGVTDDEDIVIYAPLNGISELYGNWISSSFIEGGFLSCIISNDTQTNSDIYRKLLDNKITINNPSFKKLQLVDNFIKDNIYFFAALFFSFALFSILMIFNFIIINIKNSTRDIGIYMALGMNGFKISLIYLFQVLLISTISCLMGIIFSTIILNVIDNSFNASSLVSFRIIKQTPIGVIFIILLGYLSPLLAILSPLIKLASKKPIDVIKVS